MIYDSITTILAVESIFDDEDNPNHITGLSIYVPIIINNEEFVVPLRVSVSLTNQYFVGRKIHLTVDTDENKTIIMVL